MKKIILVAVFSIFTSNAFASYSGILEFGVSGVENHSVTGSPKIGILANLKTWSAEASWQHWFTTDGNKRFNSGHLRRFGNNIYSAVVYKNVYANKKYFFSFGGGVSALEMERTDLNNTKIGSDHDLLANFSISASYKLFRATNLRVSSGINFRPYQIRPLFGALNFGVNLRF